MTRTVLTRFVGLLIVTSAPSSWALASVTTGNLLVNPGAESGEAPWELDTRFTNVQNGPLSLPNGVAIVATQGTHWFGGDRTYAQAAGLPGTTSGQPAFIIQTLDVRTYPQVEAITVGMDATGAGITILGDSLPLVSPVIILTFQDDKLNHLDNLTVDFGPTIQLQSGTAIGLSGLHGIRMVTLPAGTAFISAQFRMSTGLGPSTLDSEVRVLAGIDNTFLSLTYTPVPGDYSQNGVVDAADYVVWRETFGMSGPGFLADGDANGTVDQSDYFVWRARFGNTSGSGSSLSATIPEPTGLILVCLGAFAIRRW